jgi:hypothetical protein
VNIVTDSNKREIDEIVNQMMRDPEKLRAVRKALLEKTDTTPASKEEDDGADDLWDNLPI